MKKRVVSLLLCLIMALSLIPTAAFAAEASSQDDGISLTSIRPDDQRYYTYEFYLSSNSSHPDSTQIVKEGDELCQPATPSTEEGKVFTGWYDETDKLFTGFGKVGTIAESQTIKLYARIEDGYYVFFMNNDTVIATKTGQTNDKVTFADVSFPVEADQAITGWYTDKELTQSAGESVTIGTSNTYLYAKVEKGHWITFDSDGGSYVEPKFFATSKNTEKPNDPAKPGYAFAGWNTEDDTAYTFGNLLAANITLKAHWTAQNGVKYTVIHWQENANDDGYSFAESVQLTGTPGQLTEDAVDKIYKGFTLREKPEQKTIAGNGSTIVNVYYKRNVYKVTFAQNSNKGNDLLCGKEEHSHTWNDRKLSWGGWKYKGGCYPANSYSQSPICGIEAHNHNNNYCYGTIYNDLTISAKYGAYIGDKWPTKDGSSTWGVTRWDRWTEKVTYQVNIDTMPLGGATFYGPKTGQGSETAYYYVEVLPGETGTEGNGAYKEHHHDTSPGTGYKVSQNDKYRITGFTYDHGTSNGKSYDNAKFYYTRNSHDIVFFSGGQKVNTLSKKFEQSIADVNYTPTAPEGKEGYQFVGWYDNELCEGNAYDFTGKTMPAQNITLYAKWVAPVHTVTVYAPDRTKVLGTFERVPHKSTIGVNTMPEYTAPTGYEFLGWVKEDGTPFNFNTEITRNYKLYAKIGSTATYTVTYDKNGGSGTMADTAKYAEGATASVMKNTFTAPSGKVFLGWSTTANGSVEYYANSQLKITGNMTLYAIWGDKDSTVTLTYNANYEGAVPATREFPSLKNNALVQLAAASLFPREDYELTGWNTKADGSGTSFAAGSNARVDKLGENVLYAQWERQTGTLTITKTITGLDKAKDISFTVTGPNSYNQSITIPANRFSNTNGNFIGSVPVSNLPVGEYTVTENSATVDGYTLNTTTTNLTNGKVTVNKEGTTVSFINTYVKHTTAKITITKNVNVTGNTQPTTMPTFQFVAKVDGTKVGELSLTPTKGTDGKWTASGVMDITIPATLFVKDTVDVKISEVDGKLNYWTYDKNVKSLQIAKNGTIHNPVIVKSAAEVVPTDPIASFTFTNEYKYTYTPPTRPSNPIRRQPTTTTKPVQSVKTGDMGIALYAVTSLLSLSGTALLIKKRKDEK